MQATLFRTSFARHICIHWRRSYKRIPIERMRIHLAGFLLATPGLLGAQTSVPGGLQGIVIERVPSRSIVAASIAVARVDTEGVASSATPDANGHYRIASLPPGRYMVQVTAPVLDSLELALPSRDVHIASGESVQADFVLPFGTALRDAVCAGLNLGRGKAVVAGKAVDADTDQPIADGEVVVSWSGLALDRTNLKATAQDHVARVRTGARGEYRLCGVPTDTWLTVQLQHAGRGGAAVRVAVSEEEGAVVRNLSLSGSSAATLAALDSAERAAPASGGDSTVAELRLTGTAAVSGFVRGRGGQPLANAEVRVRDAQATALTNEAGRFVLSRLPAGTQVMLVRHLGYELTEIPVELRAGQSVTHDVQLTHAVSLDSIRVVALRSMYSEFEFDRHAYFMGRFLTLDDIEKKKAGDVSDLFADLGGFRVVGQGHDAFVVSDVAKYGHPSCGAVRVVIDGLEGASVNDVRPSEVVGIEAYRMGDFAPGVYAVRGSCGVVVIWTKASARNPQRGRKPGGSATP